MAIQIPMAALMYLTSRPQNNPNTLTQLPARCYKQMLRAGASLTTVRRRTSVSDAAKSALLLMFYLAVEARSERVVNSGGELSHRSQNTLL